MTLLPLPYAASYGCPFMSPAESSGYRLSPSPSLFPPSIDAWIRVPREPSPLPTSLTPPILGSPRHGGGRSVGLRSLRRCCGGGGVLRRGRRVPLLVLRRRRARRQLPRRPPRPPPRLRLVPRRRLRPPLLRPRRPAPPPIPALCPSCRPADPPPLPLRPAAAPSSAADADDDDAVRVVVVEPRVPAAALSTRIGTALDGAAALSCAAKLRDGTCDKGIARARARARSRSRSRAPMGVAKAAAEEGWGESAA
uniref:Uncharacterized protein n=1 Tax=Ananas comosus var. bracteatus TaxID=296719 RepID=A0A6V7QAY5_ANACO|nr:unnamed protein product [Ananas comosus var. bracteatus]